MMLRDKTYFQKSVVHFEDFVDANDQSAIWMTLA